MKKENQKRDRGIAMNVRGIDENLYNEFKSAVYLSGFKNVKNAIQSLMKVFVAKSDENRINNPNVRRWVNQEDAET